MNYKQSLVNNYPQLRFAYIIDSLKILIKENNFKHLTPHYDSLIKEYNNLMED